MRKKWLVGVLTLALAALGGLAVGAFAHEPTAEEQVVGMPAPAVGIGVEKMDCSELKAMDEPAEHCWDVTGVDTTTQDPTEIRKAICAELPEERAEGSPSCDPERIKRAEEARDSAIEAGVYEGPKLVDGDKASEVAE